MDRPFIFIGCEVAAEFRTEEQHVQLSKIHTLTRLHTDTHTHSHCDGSTTSAAAAGHSALRTFKPVYNPFQILLQFVNNGDVGVDARAYWQQKCGLVSVLVQLCEVIAGRRFRKLLKKMKLWRMATGVQIRVVLPGGWTAFPSGQYPNLSIFLVEKPGVYFRQKTTFLSSLSSQSV